MSAYVWIDEAKADALEKSIPLLGDCQEARVILEILDELKKSEQFKLNDLFVIG